MTLHVQTRPGMAHVDYPPLQELLEQVARWYPLPVLPFENGLTINWVRPGERARPVVRRSNYRSTGKFPSRKNGRMVQWESKNELAAIRILEASPSVARYADQPAVISFSNADGATSVHYPDLLAELISGARLLIEIKPDRDSHDPALLARTQHLTPLLKAKGIHYIVVSSRQLTAGYSLATERNAHGKL